MQAPAGCRVSAKVELWHSAQRQRPRSRCHHPAARVTIPSACRRRVTCSAAGVVEAATTVHAASGTFLPFLAGVATSTVALFVAGQLATPGPDGLLALLGLVPALGGQPRPRRGGPIRLGVAPQSPDTVLVGPGVSLMQLLLDHFYMGLASQLAVVIRRRIQPGLEQLQSATLRETRVEDLTLGDVPPTVSAIKVYATGDPDTFIADLAVTWESNGRLLLAVSLTERGDLSVPVEVADIRFKGLVRIVMTPALRAPPFMAAMTFSSVGTPNIDFRVKVLGGEVSAIPGLGEQLMAYVTGVTDAVFTWPKRLVLPFRRVNDIANLNTILSPDAIAALREELFASALSRDRVLAWGSRGMTRRIPMMYSNPTAAGNGRRSPWRWAVDTVVDWRKRRAEQKAAKAAAAAETAQRTAPAAEASQQPGGGGGGGGGGALEQEAVASDSDQGGSSNGHSLVEAARLEELDQRRAARVVTWGGDVEKAPQAGGALEPSMSVTQPRRPGFLRRMWRQVRGKAVDG